MIVYSRCSATTVQHWTIEYLSNWSSSTRRNEPCLRRVRNPWPDVSGIYRLTGYRLASSATPLMSALTCMPSAITQRLHAPDQTSSARLAMRVTDLAPESRWVFRHTGTEPQAPGGGSPGLAVIVCAALSLAVQSAF